jgi:small subunit ribosomal protein S6
VSKVILDRGGEVKDVDQWGRRRLAYPIRRFQDGFYAVFHFVSEPTDIRPLERNLDLAEDVLRHLVVRREEVPRPPVRTRVPVGARASAAARAEDDGAPAPREETPPPPRRASEIGEDALDAAGEEPAEAPGDTPLTPREQARVEADVDTSDLPEGEAPVAEEAGLEPEEPDAYVTTEPDAPSGEEE